MHTRISRFADKTIEATILAAVLTIPLFFDPYSSRVFEGEKVSLLRTLALIAFAAGLIRILEMRGATTSSPSRFTTLREQPTVLAAAVWGLLTVVAGLTSITPRLSLWGSYQRGQGILTALSHLVLFFAAVLLLRDRGARRRLVTTLLVASAPISIFAILQFAGVSLTPLRSLDPSRVYATLANPIFLGAYLVMAIPLTLAQITGYFTGDGAVSPLGLSAYGVLLALQMAAMVFSGSRGPLLGVVGGIILFGFLLALQSRRRLWATVPLGLTLLGLIFLIVFNLPNTPLAGLEGVPVIGRFGDALGGGSGEVRVLIWQGIVERFAGEPARLALGYGPESTHAALLTTYQPELRRLEPDRLPDRAHNVFLEALVTTGLLGAASLLFLFAALFYTGLRSLGWISTSRARNQWLALTLGGVALGGLLPRVVAGSWTYAGVGVGLGLLAGLGAFLTLCLARSGRQVAGGLTDRRVLVAAVLAVMAGHLLEVIVGIRVTATETLFWVLAGLLVALSVTEEGGERETTPAVRSTAGDEGAGEGLTLVWSPEAAVLGVLGGLMLSTLAFGLFLLAGTGVSTSAAGRWTVLLGAWLLAGPLWLAAPDADFSPGTGWIYPLISLGWAAVFLAVRGLIQVAGGDAIVLLNFYFIWLVLSLVSVGVLLPRRGAQMRSSSTLQAVAYPILVVVALGLIPWLAIQPVQADIYLEAADANVEAGQWSQALAFYEQAADQAPNVDVYQQHLGEAYVSAALLVQDPNQREMLFQSAEQAFQRAVTRNPAEATHLFNLAHLYLLWGQAPADLSRQATLLNQAADLYAQLATRTPNDSRVFDEWGVALQGLGNTDAALEKFRQALDVDPDDAQAYFHMGSLYQRSGKTDQALQMYQQAVELEPDRAATYRALADVYREEGRLLDAVDAQQRAAQLQPTDYAIHQNLALLYRDLGQIQNAVAEARLALNYAPAERRDALQSFIQSLLASESP